MAERPYRTAAIGALRVLDVLLIGGGLWIVCRAHGMPWEEQYAITALWAPALHLMIAEGRGLYRSWWGEGLRQDIGQIATAWTLTVLALLALIFVTKTSAEFSRRVFLTWFALEPIALLGARIALRHLTQAVRGAERNQRRAAIAGAGELGVRVAESFRSQPWMGITVAGFYDDRASLLARRTEFPETVRGTLDDLVAAAKRGEFDLIYLTLPLRAEKRMQLLARRLATTRASVYFVPDLLAFSLLRSRWSSIGSFSCVSLFETPFAGFERLVKRAEDVVVGTLVLAVIALPMLLIAAAIKLTSPGPVIFKQRRYGLDGREIIVWKFRTMTVCEDGVDFRQARRDDPRVTRLGRFLRASSLDELPQFINVLQGSMSIVGPRPHPILLDEQHREAIDWYMLRHRVKPGITGWAQIHGYRGETDAPEKMQRRIEHDLAYIRDWSLGLDLRIIARTPFVSFFGDNAY